MAGRPPQAVQAQPAAQAAAQAPPAAAPQGGPGTAPLQLPGAQAAPDAAVQQQAPPPAQDAAQPVAPVGVQAVQAPPVPPAQLIMAQADQAAAAPPVTAPPVVQAPAAPAPAAPAPAAPAPAAPAPALMQYTLNVMVLGRQAYTPEPVSVAPGATIDQILDESLRVMEQEMSFGMRVLGVAHDGKLLLAGSPLPTPGAKLNVYLQDTHPAGEQARLALGLDMLPPNATPDQTDAQQALISAYLAEHPVALGDVRRAPGRITTAFDEIGTAKKSADNARSWGKGAAVAATLALIGGGAAYALNSSHDIAQDHALETQGHALDANHARVVDLEHTVNGLVALNASGAITPDQLNATLAKYVTEKNLTAHLSLYAKQADLNTTMAMVNALNYTLTNSKDHGTIAYQLQDASATASNLSAQLELLKTGNLDSAQLAKLQSNLNSLSAQYNTTKEYVTQLNNSLTTAQAALAANAGDVDNLEARMNGLSTLNATVTGMQGQLLALNSTIGDLQLAASQPVAIRYTNAQTMLSLYDRADALMGGSGSLAAAGWLTREDVQQLTNGNQGDGEFSNGITYGGQPVALLVTPEKTLLSRVGQPSLRLDSSKEIYGALGEAAK